ncbi:MAG TPA: helix-turn-helix transcriptional regulator [Bryobacteraceae bacterium]|nr:helix-turn-helix transcriptional regulator [Bryobacteraceae bacterium]
MTPSSSCPVTDTGGSTVRRRDIAGFSLSEGLYAAGVSLPRHCHADAYLTVVLSGNYIERFSHREFHWGEGAIHLLPAGEHHENHFLSAVRLLRVKIGPDVVQRLGKEHAHCLAEPREIAGPLSKWLANRMMREFMAQDDIAPLAMEGVLLEMLAESARSSAEIHSSSAPSWLRRVRESLEERYLESPSLSSLAGVAGVHPVHLSREFHRHYLMTVGEYMRKRRIQHASELLARSELSLAEIANTCGFSDQSHFCALFKKHSGMTPAKFRDAAGGSTKPKRLVMASL